MKHEFFKLKDYVIQNHKHNYCKTDLEYLENNSLVSNAITGQLENFKGFKLSLLSLSFLENSAIEKVWLYFDYANIVKFYDEYLNSDKFTFFYDEMTVRIQFFGRSKSNKLNSFFEIAITSSEDLCLAIKSTVDVYKDVLKLLEQKDIKFSTHSEHKLETNSINWAIGYDSHRRISYNEIPVKESNNIKDAFYPSITEKYNVTVNEFIDEYLKSDESVLLLTGKKGSGKTELIRQIIARSDKNAQITFNKEIIKDNSFYYDFFSSDYYNILIIEDADDILMKRESGNDIMDLFLNLSDGIVSNKEKKFIFTSNLPNLNSIDDALLRNGRCFATIEFKTLTEEQGKTIAEDLNIEYNNSIGCLADAFAIKNKFIGQQEKTKPKRGFGFV